MFATVFEAGSSVIYCRVVHESALCSFVSLCLCPVFHMRNCSLPHVSIVEKFCSKPRTSFRLCGLWYINHICFMCVVCCVFCALFKSAARHCEVRFTRLLKRWGYMFFLALMPVIDRAIAIIISADISFFSFHYTYFHCSSLYCCLHSFAVTYQRFAYSVVLFLLV